MSQASETSGPPAGGADRPLDLVVWGATGFTGRLVAEHLAARYPPGSELSWGIGGRNPEKLVAVRSSLPGWGDELPIVAGDSRDRGSLDRLVAGTRVVCSTVGPFARYGDELVAACAAAGTHYCDITGEVQWVRRMIDRHEEEARESGARLVHCCGFDSIPSDLGCFVLQTAARERWGSPAGRIVNGVRKMRGRASGGTAASLLEALREAQADREVRRALGHPYGLNPEGRRQGPDGSDQKGPRWDADLERWTAPFVMAAVNTRVVRRSAALRPDAYGESFSYREALVTGRGLAGRLRAIRVTAMLGGFFTAASIGPTRALLERFVLPSPGEGPSTEERERGSFEMLLVGTHDRGVLGCRVSADRDPGYGATSRMLGETAACLALDGERLPVAGGSWTPATAMGTRLVERLEAHAGMRFELLE